MGNLTESLADFVASLRTDDIPEGAEAIVGTGFADAIGVTIAALDQPVYRHLKGAVAAMDSGSEARIVLTPDRQNAPNAALVGAATAHALDYDDYAFSNHVSAVLVPAIMAEAEVTGASGRDMVAAYVAGYEVWRDIMGREPGDWYARGWHPTAVFGAFGSTAASAFLRGLPAEKIRHAFGLCLVQGGGVMDNFGTMAKPFQGGCAAQAGLLAVRFAEAGLDAGPDAVDGVNGYLRGLSPTGEVDAGSPADKLGKVWGILKERLNIKAYPTVGASQRGIDCAIQLHRDAAPEPARISKIRAHISERHANVMPHHQPQTALEAKFSQEFAVVAGLLEGQVGFKQLTDGFVQRGDVQTLMGKVELVIGPDDDPVYPAGKRADLVEVVMDDGRTIVSDEVTRWRGHGANPMTCDELRVKFMDCATRMISEEDAAGYFEKLVDVAAMKSMAALPDLQLE